MIFIDKMQNLKIYKTKTFLPTVKGDKKRGHIVLMLTPNFNSSKNLMNNDMFVNSNRYQSYYLEKDVSYYINSKVVEEVEESAILNEQAELEDLCLETKRSELPDSEFGVPEQRKFPLDTEAHVRSAIKFFNYVEPKYEAELARRIIAKMKKFGIDDVNVSEQNRFSKYYHPKKSVKEDTVMEINSDYMKQIHQDRERNRSNNPYTWKSVEDYKNDNGNAWCSRCKKQTHWLMHDLKNKSTFWCPSCKTLFPNVHDEGLKCPKCKNKLESIKISMYERVRCGNCGNTIEKRSFIVNGDRFKFIDYAKPPEKNVDESAEWIKDESLAIEEQKDVEVKKCKFCGSEDILVKIDGEPVYICKDCGKYLGTVPFKEEYTDDSLMNTDYFLKVIPENDVIDLGDKIVFLNESEINDKRLKQMLFKARIRKRKDVLNILDQVKAEVPWIKYAFPEIKKYNRRNLFMDLSYYTTIFFENNTWRMKKGFGLYLDFMSRLINHPVTKSEGYTGRTIFVPVEDWNKTHDNMIWNYKINLNPMSCIYQLLFEGKLPELKKAFGNTDVVFFGKTCYFKINFSTLDPKEIKRYAAKFRVFCVKICNSEEFEPEDIDTTADNAESPEVLQAKIADKIEVKTGVDITKAVVKAVEKKKALAGVAADVPDAPAPLHTNGERDKLYANHKTLGKIYNKVNASNLADITFQAKAKMDDPAANRIITRLKELDKDLDDEVDVDYDTQDDAEKEADIDKLADALVNATQDSTDEEEALDKMDHDDYDDEIKRIYLTLGNDDEVKISDARAARMTEMDKQVLDKEINGRSIKDILSEENKSTKQETTTIKVASPNQDEWTDLGYMNLDKQYDIDRDIVAIFKSFANTSRPMVIRDIQVTNNSTSEDRIVLYDVQMEDYKGRRYRIKLDIPIMEDNRFLLRGYSKSINCQFLNAPILKVALDSCHILSNYSKIIMERMNDTSGRSLPATAKFMKTIGKYTGKTLKFTPGNNFKVCAKYHLPIDYIDLANSLSKIESPKWIIYFNQDEIREQYTVDETKGIPVLYNKELKAIEYYTNNPDNDTFIGYLLSIVENTDPAFGDLYATITRSSSSAYTRCHIMSQYIPTALVCAYHVGLTEMLKRAGIEYRTVEKLDSEIKHDASYDWIEFDDGYLVYKVTYNSSLLMNGLKIKTCGTEAYKLADMDNRNMYLDFLDSFGGRIIADGLDNFKDLFVDPMTIETLKYYHLPTDYIDILLYGSNMLADNKFVKHTDARSKKLRRYQLVSVYTYNVLAKAYGRYITGDKHSNNPQFTVKQTDVIDKFLTDNITSDDSCINALREVETTNAVTTKGPSGMNSDRAYSLDKRGYDESMVNVLGMSTGFAGNAGITRQTTINADITPDGFVRDTTGKDMNDANTLTATESLIPFGSTRDDPMRTAMSFVQTSKHMVRTEESDPLLVTSGADEVMPYLTTDKFAYKAKGDGKVIELNEHYCIIEYTDGKKDYINFDEKIEKNSDGGYYVPLKLDPAEGLKLNSRVKKNQIVAYDKYSFSNNLGESNNLAYNIGKLAKIAILNTDEGFEDAGIISASMAKKLATRVNIKYDCVINKDSRLFQIVKVGDHVEASDDLVIWEDAVDDSDSEEVMKALSGKDFSDLGKRKLKSDVTGVVTAIKIYRTVELDDLSPSLHKLVSAYEKPLAERAKVLEANNIPYAKTKVDAYYKLNPTGKLKKSQEAIFVEIFVEYLDTVGVGDKIVYNSANKAVEKGIFPEGKEPYTAFRPNEKIDAFVADTSISKRIVTSTYVYGAIQKALIELDRSVKDIMGIPYDDSTV